MRALCAAVMLTGLMTLALGCGEKQPTIGNQLDKAVDSAKDAAKDAEKKAEKVKKDVTQ